MKLDTMAQFCEVQERENIILVFCDGTFYCNVRQLFDVKDILFSSKLNKIRGSKTLNKEKNIWAFKMKKYCVILHSYYHCGVRSKFWRNISSIKCIHMNKIN